MNTKAERYEFELTDWDKVNGIGPVLLTTARNRAKVLMKENMSQANTESQTAIFRGAFAELTELINALESAGVK